MVVVPGDASLLAGPLAAVGGLAGGGIIKDTQQTKRDIERHAPPLPSALKPTEMSLPSPETLLQDLEMKIREVASFPLRLLESGEIPSPIQGLQGLENKRPVERLRRHALSIPTPFEIFKTTIGKDIVTPREFARDAERMMEDGHVLAEGANEAFQAQYPVTIQNMKQASADLNAMRVVGVEFIQASGKALTRVAKSTSKLLSQFSDDGILGLIF